MQYSTFTIMSGNGNEETGLQQTGLHSLERNRYFFGKLIGPREMRMEQDYFTERSNMHSQFVSGSGIICGLELSDPVQNGTTDTGGHLTVTLNPGIAIGGHGRPIVVEDSPSLMIRKGGKSGDYVLPAGNKVHVFLTYTERGEGLVPVPGEESAREDRKEANKMVEEFDLYFTESNEASEPHLTQSKRIRDVDFPKVPDIGNLPLEDDESIRRRKLAYRHQMNRIAHTYRNKEPSYRACETSSDPSVFVGTLKKTVDEATTHKWEVSTEETENPLPYVYSNDMLYAGLSRLSLQVNPLKEHLVKTTLSNTRTTFNKLADEYEADNPQGQAHKIASGADMALKEMIPPEFPDGTSPFISLLIDVKQQDRYNQMTNPITGLNQEDKDRFEKVADELIKAVEHRDTPTPRHQELYIATLQDWVNEAAGWLSQS